MNLELRNEILKFDKIGVSGKEINEHISFYYDNANECMKLYQENKSEALKIFKIINKNLKKEYDYYSKSSFDVFLYCPDKAKQYVYYIQEIRAKCIRTNSYETLFSNLYDIVDYKKYNITTKFEDDLLYGSIWINVINDEIEKSNNEEKINVLKILKLFYLKPSKGKAKDIEKISKYIRKHNLEEFIIETFFERFLDI